MDYNIAALDIGNTATKIGLIATNNLSCKRMHIIPSHNVQAIIKQISSMKQEFSSLHINHLNISTCIKSPNLLSRLTNQSEFKSIQYVKYHRHLPFIVNYENPQLLGTDRIANCLYGLKKYPGENLLIIDVGTAINIDLISASCQYLGGYIIPGINTQLYGLYQRASQLPKIQFKLASDSFPAQSTQMCMLGGVLYSLVGGISLIVKKFHDRFPVNRRILTCGGDWYALESYLDFEYCHHPELTLIGIALYK